MSAPTITRQDHGRIPQLEEQIAVLNAALTASELRHVETQQKLEIALTLLCHFDEQLEAAKEGA